MGGGPSLKYVDQELLDRFPCVTMAINHHAHRAGLRTDHCVFIDGVRRNNGRQDDLQDTWIEILNDPQVTKWTRKEFDNPGEPQIHAGRNVKFFRPCKNTSIDDFFDSDEYYIGDEQVKPDPDEPGIRFYHLDSMFPAFRILYELGVRRVYLLGVDFRSGQCGQFERFAFMSRKLVMLLPAFRRVGLEVVNCTHDSMLGAYPQIDFPKHGEVLEEVMM